MNGTNVKKAFQKGLSDALIATTSIRMSQFSLAQAQTVLRCVTIVCRMISRRHTTSFKANKKG